MDCQTLVGSDPCHVRQNHDKTNLENDGFPPPPKKKRKFQNAASKMVRKHFIQTKMGGRLFARSRSAPCGRGLDCDILGFPCFRSGKKSVSIFQGISVHHLRMSSRYIHIYIYVYITGGGICSFPTCINQRNHVGPFFHGSCAGQNLKVRTLKTEAAEAVKYHFTLVFVCGMNSYPIDIGMIMSQTLGTLYKSVL